MAVLFQKSNFLKKYTYQFCFQTMTQQFTTEIKKSPVNRYCYSAAETLLEHIKVHFRMIDNEDKICTLAIKSVFFLQMLQP